MQTSVLFFIRNHSSVLGALAFVLVASASSGCSTEPCPDGTKQDGDVCRRIPATMKNANQGAGSGAMKPGEDDLDDEDLDNPGKAGKGGAGGKTATASAGKGGSGTDEETDGAGEGSSGKGGSGGKGGAGGAGGSKAGAGGGGAGGAGGMKAAGGMGGAGKGGTSGAAAGKGAGGMGAAGKDAAAGGGAGKDAAAGSGAAGKGEAGKGEAGKGEAGSKATEVPEEFLADTWFCVNLEGGCVCIDGKGENTDTCVSPRPKCCYVLKSVDEPNCQCHDEDSKRCEEESTSEDAIKVDSCPPKNK